MKQHGKPLKMSNRGSLRRAIRVLENGVAKPYHGTMYEMGADAIEGDWVNGLRATDVRLLLTAIKTILG